MERAEIEIDERRCRIVQLVGEEAIGEPFSYRAVCEGAPPATLGAPALVLVRDRFGNERRVEGVVASTRRSFRDADVVLEVVIRPAFWRLSLGSDHRMFSAMSALEVIESVAAEAGERLRVEVADRPPPREAIAQFGESDLAFVDRLIAGEGWVWWFDHDDRSTPVVSDARLPFVVERPVFRVREDAFDVHDEESLYGLSVAERATVSAVRLVGADRDAGGAGDGQSSSRLYGAARGSGRFERAEYAGSSHGRTDLERSVQLRFEALTAERRRLELESTSVRPYPGRAITIDGTDYVVVRARLSIEQLRRDHAAVVEQTLRCALELHPRDVPLRLRRDTAAPAPVGVQLATVVAEEEIAIGSDGRVPLRMRWDRRESTRPARVAQRPTADSALYPRAAWNVLALPERGSLDEPTVLGRVFDAEHPPPYALPDAKTKMVYQTATTPGGGSSNEIAFDGALGREEMFVNASGDLGSAANHHDGERVQGDATRVVGHDEALFVGGDDHTAVAGNLTMQIGEGESLEIAGAHGTQVEGDVSETIGASRSLHVGKEHAVAVNGKRTQKVGAVTLDATLGPIKSEAQSSASVLTGGVRVKVARGAVTESATLGSALLVGGVRLDVGAAGVKIETRSSLRERVGGAVIMRTARHWKQQALSYGSYKAATVKLEAPDINIIATGRILVVTGSSSIRVDADGVEIRGKAVTAEGAMWVAECGPQTTLR